VTLLKTGGGKGGEGCKKEKTRGKKKRLPGCSLKCRASRTRSGPHFVLEASDMVAQTSEVGGRTRETTDGRKNRGQSRGSDLPVRRFHLWPCVKKNSRPRRTEEKKVSRKNSVEVE